jgi:hypothetical protein
LPIWLICCDTGTWPRFTLIPPWALTMPMIPSGWAIRPSTQDVVKTGIGQNKSLDYGWDVVHFLGRANSDQHEPNDQDGGLVITCQMAVDQRHHRMIWAYCGRSAPSRHFNQEGVTLLVPKIADLANPCLNPSCFEMLVTPTWR